MLFIANRKSIERMDALAENLLVTVLVCLRLGPPGTG